MIHGNEKAAALMLPARIFKRFFALIFTLIFTIIYQRFFEFYDFLYPFQNGSCRWNVDCAGDEMLVAFVGGMLHYIS